VSLTIRPTDALIQRLLQNSTANKTAPTTPPQNRAVADQVNISAQARQASQTPSAPQSDMPTTPQNVAKQANLEERILRMYGHAQQRHESKS